jgi:hypothetical protein
MLADGVVGVDLDGDFKTASEKPPSFEESFNSWLKAQGSRPALGGPTRRRALRRYVLDVWGPWWNAAGRNFG